MNLEILKKIARSNEYQLLYNRAKEIGTLRLFKNDSDLSRIQILYLYFLEMYSILYQDLNAQVEFLDETVIEDDLRCEAYLLYRKTKRNEKSDKDSDRHIDSSGGLGSVVFKRGKTGK